MTVEMVCVWQQQEAQEKDIGIVFQIWMIFTVGNINNLSCFNH